MSNNYNPTLPHHTRLSQYKDWHKQRHAMLNIYLLELVEDYLLIAAQPIDRVTVQDFLMWAADQAKNPT